MVKIGFKLADSAAAYIDATAAYIDATASYVDAAPAYADAAPAYADATPAYSDATTAYNRTAKIRLTHLTWVWAEHANIYINKILNYETDNPSLVYI